MDDALSRTTGSVVLQVGALELLARYSMNAARATSVMSSLHEFRQRDAEQTGGKQWNWKYLRDQFDQKDLEGLYRKYDDKLKETLIYIYVSLLIFFSTIHVALVIAGTFNAEIQWMSTYLSLGMYLLRISIPLLSFWKCFYDPLKRRWFWVPIMLAFVLTADLVLTDIAITIYSSSEGVSLRPAYATMALLSVYIFLPIRNNFLAIILGVIVSAVYILVFAFFTYASDPQIEVVVACDVIYLIGVNFMGIYFRLMNEIITRRSFLDRRACVESTLRLKFVKDQEERLMSSILPEHIVSRVRQDIRNMFLDIRSQRHPHNMKSFSQLYVEEHENVSILYADVVNYTQISTTLPPMRMVELLNELFGRFDEASEEHDVLRIKFLGDCYYCVSGVPKPTAQHAKNCLDLGLEMISIIKDVREKRSLNIDMRIGVHSGRILSGLIGIRKWQFDIWSKDVTIANRMEATGRAGKVHITKQTLELVLEHAREYIIEPNFASQHDPFVVKHKLETYLVTRTPKSTGDYKPFRRASVGPNKAMTTRSRARYKIVLPFGYLIFFSPVILILEKVVCRRKQESFQPQLLELGDRLLCSMRSRVVVQEQLRRAIDHCWLEMKQLIYHCDQFFTVHTCRLLQHSLTKQRPIIFLVRSENRSSSTFRRTTSFMDENLVEYQQMLKAADAQMAKEIGDMTSGKEQVRKELKLNRFTLMYKDFNLEKSFLLQPDPLFKYYMTCCLLILLLIFLINGLSTRWLENFKWSAWVSFGFLFILLTTMQPISWFHFFWRKYKGIAEPRDPRLRRLYDLSINIIKCPKIRTGVYLLVSSALAATSIVNVVGCEEAEVQPSTETVLSNCVSSWHVTQCWSLALLLNFLFSRVFFMFKWVVAGGMTLFYLWIVWEVKSPLFYIDVTWNIGLDPRVSHTLSVVFVTITLYWIDRTTEYRNRLDHLWQIQVSEEQTEAETMLKVNNMLLENILPAHVVQVYLDLNRSIDELYYEKYDNVVVMFASLTDYKLGLEGGQQADLSDKFVLSILDEVISDFDRLLLTGTSVYKVEKIKMAGWTYMAACGLDPNRRDSFDSTSFNSFVDRRQNTPYNRAIVVTMVEFAAAMMMQLQNFNRGSFQSFEELNLRIGISNGEVAAGVVGSLKPLYDIWGDAVNMASRMDSTGESGRIQVTENTANILGECGIVTMYRGETFVKGRGYVRTYFVPLDDDFNLIKKHKEIEPNVKNHFHVNFNTLAHSISMTENIIDISCESENSTLELKNSSSENDSSDDFTENEDENSRKNSGDNKLGKVNIIAELNDNIGDVRDGKNVSADADTTETRC